LFSLSIPVTSAVGHKLTQAVFRADGGRMFARGRRLTPEDVGALERQLLTSVEVLALDSDEVDEETIIEALASRLGNSLEAIPLPGAQVEFVANSYGVFSLDTERLAWLNGTGIAVVASLPHFAPVRYQQRAMLLRSRPFGCRRKDLEVVMAVLDDSAPIGRVVPFHKRPLGCLFVDPVSPDRAKRQFEPGSLHWSKFFDVPCRTRLCLDTEDDLNTGIQNLLSKSCEVILVASTVTPIVPEDPIGRAIRSLGGTIETFLAPVDPGSLLMLGRIQDTVLVCAPSCLRSTARSVLDLILPPIFARCNILDFVRQLGAGGLLSSSASTVSRAVAAGRRV
jgi:molybdenum cofactor cytidylyltransferase